jgi:two-component system cell cycle response regulator DivK
MSDKTILLIEDNEQNQYLTRFLLEKNGFTVCIASDGEVGVAMALERPLVLILLDIQLPTIDGYEVARRIRAAPGVPQVPIVAVTSHAMVGDRDKSIAAGCNGYIEKPIDPDTFIGEITRFIRKDAA